MDAENLPTALQPLLERWQEQWVEEELRRQAVDAARAAAAGGSAAGGKEEEKEGEEAEEAAPPVPPAFNVAGSEPGVTYSLLAGERGIHTSGWVLLSRKDAISRFDVVERDGAALAHPLPEMYFGSNEVALYHCDSGACIRWSAFAALSECSADADIPKCAAAAKWEEAGRAEMADMVQLKYDWTFSTSFVGALSRLPPLGSDVAEGDALVVEETDERIDYELLKRRDPILWSTVNNLFEDELHDEGTSELTIRVRVMPSCFFLLARQFIRVDGVMVRFNETRLFHKFGEPHLLREYSEKAATADKLRRSGLEPGSRLLKDGDRLAGMMGRPARMVVHKILLPV
eukprot:PLAT8241.1.p1 GENE.PLAT8241.1~~PLAT8241.1.p1  ORF type:complete len:351 (-),score=112.10 PLAT8241.1:73-1104(-)